MANPTLFDTMTNQVTAECERNIAEARDEASRIQSNGEAEAQALRDRTMNSVNAEIALLDQRAHQKAEAEAAKAELELRNDVVETVMDRVQNEIKSIVSSGSFPGVLDRLLETLMSAAGENHGYVVLAPEAHLDHVKQWLSANGHGGVPVEGSRAMWDGVALQDPNRTYRISNTLTGRYTRMEQEARRHCMVSLFGSEGGA
jgi:vacuolar-type H+-ATPase subunit E/Vma4